MARYVQVTHRKIKARTSEMKNNDYKYKLLHLRTNIPQRHFWV